MVVGHWRDSPLGAFTDVMLETSRGHRILATVGEPTLLGHLLRGLPRRLVTSPS